MIATTGFSDAFYNQSEYPLMGLCQPITVPSMIATTGFSDAFSYWNDKHPASSYKVIREVMSQGCHISPLLR